MTNLNSECFQNGGKNRVFEKLWKKNKFRRYIGNFTKERYYMPLGSHRELKKQGQFSRELLFNDFDYNFNKILTLDVQIDQHRTVSNFIACLTSVFTMLTSRRVIKLKESIVANTRSVWKCPTN